MIFEINLIDENLIEKKIKYELNNLPHTKRFIQIVLDSLQIGWNKPLYTSYQIKSIESGKNNELSEQIKSLNESINFFNNNNKNNYKIDNKFKIVENVNDYHDILNEIHSKFEEYWNIYSNLENKDDDILNHLGNINQMVHLIDTTIHHCNNNESYEFYFSTHIGSQNGDIIYQELKDIDYESFTLDCKFGDLFLGYSTVGKSIIHCWSDKDIEIIKNKKVSPQRVFSTNIIAYFVKPERKHIDVLESFYKWFDDNNLSLYYDKFDKRNSLGYLKIGDLINEYGLSERLLLDYYKNCTIVSFNLIEN